jgi:hypothetical protein
MASQPHQAGFHLGHEFGVEVLVAAVDDGRKGFEGDCDHVEVVVVAVVENGDNASDDGVLVGLPAWGGRYLKALSPMRLERTPRQ